MVVADNVSSSSCVYKIIVLSTDNDGQKVMTRLIITKFMSEKYKNSHLVVVTTENVSSAIR